MIRSKRGGYGKATAKPDTVGKRIRRVRLAWKWSQIQLAEALGTNQQTVSHWERDRQEPTEATFRALSALFGMKSGALKTGEGFQVPDPPRQVGDLLVAEAYAVDLVKLPPVGEEGLLLVHRTDDSTQPLTARKAAEAIRKAREEGRPVWIVVG
jgi:transcriptional regulator with XRE-family HTH domain